MPAPVKWSTADFELINAENPEGEPWLAASPDGRFNLTFFESFAGPPAYTDIETRLYSATGLDTGLGPAPTFSATTIDHQGAVAYFPDGRSVYVWTEEPAAGGGNLEDVYASVYVGGLPSVTRFLVAGGVGRQHDPVVAASASGFVVALADDSVATGQLILKFYNAVGGLITTVLDADDPEGVNTPAGAEDDYRDVEITALANGNYVVTWTDDVNFDIWARIYSPTGVAQTGLIEIEPGGGNATFPDVTALADGRFLVTYEQFGINTVRGRIYEANGVSSVGPFTIATNAANATNQQVQSAALQDGRFVTVWRNIAGNIEGQAMKADGTADGAAFAVNGDAAGGKGRPTVATLADGRFAVSWESGAGATATIFTTIFDPREAGLYASASSFDDDWHGTGFLDQIFGGPGRDTLRGAGGIDYLYGEAGNDTLFGDAGDDRLYGGNHNDTLNGGLNNDLLYGQLGNDTLNGNEGDDIWLDGGDGNDTANGGIGNDRINGGVGSDTLNGDAGDDNITAGAGDDTVNGGADSDRFLGGEAGDDTINGGLGNDVINGGADNDTLNGNEGGDNISGGTGIDTIDGGDDDDPNLAGDAGNDTINGGLGSDHLHGGSESDTLNGDDGIDIIDGDAGIDFLNGGLGNDVLRGGTENDTLTGGAGLDTQSGGTGGDVFVYNLLIEGGPGEQIGDWQGGGDDLRIDASGFGGGLAAGALAANRLVIGTAANQAFGQFLFNTANGVVSWDVDGTGATAPVFLVKLYINNFAATAATLATTDFDIVA